MKKYRRVVVAGTFDHLHKGQKSLIDLAFSVGEEVIIGLVKKSFGKEKILADSIQAYQKRRIALQEYLTQKAVLHRAAIFPLTDIYGNADSDETIEALVVSRETYNNAAKINARRAKKGKKRLKIIVGLLVKSKDGKIIRSERIRQGEIDRRGNVYFDCFKGRRRLVLPGRLRGLMRKPLGRIIKSNPAVAGPNVKSNPKLKSQLLNAPMIITVGDVITSEIIKSGIIPDLQIVDFRAMRKPVKLSEIRIQRSAKKVINRAGTININAVRAINSNFKAQMSNQIQSSKLLAGRQIIVKGEEDLLALPAILLAPLGAIVLYGQWDLGGAVIVKVTEEIKEKVKKIVKKFK